MTPREAADTVRAQMIGAPGIWGKGTSPGERALISLVAAAERAETLAEAVQAYIAADEQYQRRMSTDRLRAALAAGAADSERWTQEELDEIDRAVAERKKLHGWDEPAGGTEETG